MTFTTDQVSEAGGRAANQDAWGMSILPGGAACWVVADGLGGHIGGEVAAGLAVAAALDAFEQAPEATAGGVRRYLDAAQTALLARQQQDPRLAAMRTTLVMLVAEPRAAVWGHIGDSRLYHLRAGRIAFQTEDHSVPQALVAAGDLPPEAVRFHEDRNRLLRSLGEPEELRPAIVPHPVALAPGDAFLLCTDGFWEYVRETEMEVDFAKADHPKGWVAAMRARLRSRAEAGHDNYTAVAVFVEP